MAKKIRIWTYPSNNGDGSASAWVYKTREEALDHQERDEEYEGWAEDCVSYKDIVIDEYEVIEE